LKGERNNALATPDGSGFQGSVQAPPDMAYTTASGVLVLRIGSSGLG
jgi:hypothetical protein